MSHALPYSDDFDYEDPDQLTPFDRLGLLVLLSLNALALYGLATGALWVLRGLL